MATSKRRPRQSQEELRALLLDTGRAMLRDEGLGTGVENLTFKKVFDRVRGDTGIRLTNASVIRRLWENQAEFQSDLLVAITADEEAFGIEPTLQAVTPLIDELDLSTPERRWQSLHEVLRVGGAANIEGVRRSQSWSTWIGVWALAAARVPSPDRQRISSALQDRYAFITGRYERVYSILIHLLGFRVRANLSIHQFTIAAGALTEGYALRNRIDGSDLDGIRQRSDADGENREWTLFAVALDALATHFFEVDPHWRPSGG